MEDKVEQVLSYLSYCDRRERANFLRHFLSVIPAPELKGVETQVSHAKRRRKPESGPGAVYKPVPSGTVSKPAPGPLVKSVVSVVPPKNDWFRLYKKKILCQ